MIFGKKKWTPRKDRWLNEATPDFQMYNFKVEELAIRHKCVFLPDFIPWLQISMNVFIMFEKTASQLWDDGFRRFSARWIMEGKLKFSYLDSDFASDFTVEDKRSGDLSRLYALLHPERVEMFKYARRKINFTEYLRLEEINSQRLIEKEEEIKAQQSASIDVTKEDLKLIDRAEKYSEVFRNDEFLPWLKSGTYSIYLAVMFINITNQIWNKGKRYFSARTIAEKVNYDCRTSHLPTTGDMTRYSADLARLYGLKHPRRARIFEYNEDDEYSDFIMTHLYELEEQN